MRKILLQKAEFVSHPNCWDTLLKDLGLAGDPKAARAVTDIWLHVDAVEIGDGGDPVFLGPENG